MEDQNTTKEKIEILRSKLNLLISKSENLTSNEIVTISQQLDKELNKYQKINKF